MVREAGRGVWYLEETRGAVKVVFGTVDWGGKREPGLRPGSL